jgi:ATP-dependent DNA helicase RecG
MSKDDMAIDAETLLDELNAVDEHERVEAKRGTEAGKAVMKTVVAFANEPRLDGGYILFGVQRRDADADARYEVVGVPEPDKVSRDFASQCATMLNQKIRPQVTTQAVEGKPVVAAYVPEAQPAEKPIYLKSKGLERGAYRRIGSSDQQCSDADLQEIYQERSGETYDASVVPDADLDDVDPDAIEDYRKTRAQVNPEAEELNWNDEKLLRALQCVRKKDDTLRPTVAGLLLFGTKFALRRLFPVMRIDYTRVPGREWMDDPSRRYVSSIEIRAPLLQAIRRAQSAIVDDLPKGFSLPKDSLQRTDEPLIPLRVLREAIVNAVMHRDYRTNGAVHIVRYANRIEVRNPGYSLVDPDELKAPISETRNPVIASVLHDTRFAETKGTGIEVMRENLREAGLAPPEFESDRTADHFVTTFYLHHFLDTDDLDWLGRFKHLNLSEAQIRGLIHAREAGRIDNETYRELNGVETLKASQHLRRLREADLLKQHEKGRATYYEPTETLLGTEPTAQSELPFDDDTETASEASRPNKETTQAEGETSKLEAEPLDAEAEILDDQDESLDAPDLPSDLPNELADLIRDVHGQRLSQQKLRDALRRLCQWKPLSMRDLATLLGKRKEYLSTHVTPMVEQDELERTQPDAPRSPNQKYRAPGNE